MTSQRPKKILIVEDEQDIAQLVKHHLEKEGFHSNIAKTGLEHSSSQYLSILISYS